MTKNFGTLFSLKNVFVKCLVNCIFSAWKLRQTLRVKFGSKHMPEQKLLGKIFPNNLGNSLSMSMKKVGSIGFLMSKINFLTWARVHLTSWKVSFLAKIWHGPALKFLFFAWKKKLLWLDRNFLGGIQVLFFLRPEPGRGLKVYGIYLNFLKTHVFTWVSWLCFLPQISTLKKIISIFFY